MVSKVLDGYPTMNSILSPTFQSSQLHTPRHLSRITIDDNKYQGYRSGSLGSLTSREGTANKLDESIWGRKHAYGGIGVKPTTEPIPLPLGSEFPRSHKHFISGIHPRPRTRSTQQIYTPIDLDNIRTNQYKIRELQSPFPAEHPFYSHTPRFSLFPAIQGAADSSEANRPSSAGCTEGLVKRLSSARPPSGNPNYTQAGSSVYPDLRIRAPTSVVLSKTKGQGIRQEMSASRRVRSAAENWELDDVIARAEGNTVWDVPRSARHERVSTYPSPRLIFEGSNNWSRHGAVSARTNHVLENLQRSYLQTTYQRQFTGVGPGEAKLDDYLPGYRPYSAERGSAVSTRTQLPSANYYKSVPWEGRHSASAAHFLRQPLASRGTREGDMGTREGDMGTKEGYMGTRESDDDSSSDEDSPDKLLSSRRVSFRNKSGNQSDCVQLSSPLQSDMPEVTQHIYDPDQPTIDTDRTTTLSVTPLSPMSLKSSLKRVQISERPSSAPSEPALESSRTPRTITSSKRLMDAYTFNRSNIRKSFHYNYPEVSPDLRELARYPSAKRHNIHGVHSYYFH